MARYKRGDKIHHYVLVSWIGEGGNAEVWSAKKNDGPLVALKILTRTHGDGYNRFRDEIAILKKLTGSKGILPILDSYLPETPVVKNPAWLAMPIAELLEKRLRDQPLE
jgi:serine/threonine protein kinase